MNFYISNFNYKKNIKEYFLTFLILALALDLVLLAYSKSRTTKDCFIENVSSKTKHMKINAKNKNIIFIGSSRTIYQISSHYFEQNGLEVYNYGISGRHVVNFPSMVESAIEVHPKCVALSIDAEKFYEPILPYMSDPQIEDIGVYIKTKQKMKLIFKSIVEFAKNIHLLNLYDTVIYEKIRQIYAMFEPTRKNIAGNYNNKKSDINNSALDCKSFSISMPGGTESTETIVKCTNGDGIIFGNTIISEPKPEKVGNLNSDYLRMFNFLLAELRLNGIRSIVIYTPRYKNPYLFDTNKLSSKIASDNVIDFTKFEIPKIYWGDSAHLNNNGRLLYSEEIYKRVKDVCQ